MVLAEIGIACKAFRERMGLTQLQVASELNCSKENVSAFETGRNNSATIYSWYVEHGLFLDRIGFTPDEIPQLIAYYKERGLI